MGGGLVGQLSQGLAGHSTGVWGLFWVSRSVLSMSFHLGSRRETEKQSMEVENLRSSVATAWQELKD